mmetsp:Transcript_27577/g.67076  ORF Transcript_27577/g.67076 Transcript_27577/m.67076 type:complete len:202 (+) Transcript_27577:80-685(+)
MAFEQQLEADRIDDFNLFSAFVRVPLLILEGVLGQQQQQQQEGEEEQSKCERSTLPKHSSETRPQDHTVSSPLRVVSNDNMSSSSAVRGGNANAKKQLGWMDKSNSYSSLSRTRSGHTSLADIVGSPRLKKNRQTSWSDESGLSLVEYLGEVSFVFHLVRPGGIFVCNKGFCLDSFAGDALFCFGGLSSAKASLVGYLGVH